MNSNTVVGLSLGLGLGGCLLALFIGAIIFYLGCCDIEPSSLEGAEAAPIEIGGIPLRSKAPNLTAEEVALRETAIRRYKRRLRREALEKKKEENRLRREAERKKHQKHASLPTNTASTSSPPPPPPSASSLSSGQTPSSLAAAHGKRNENRNRGGSGGEAAPTVADSGGPRHVNSRSNDDTSITVNQVRSPISLHQDHNHHNRNANEEDVDQRSIERLSNGAFTDSASEDMESFVSSDTWLTASTDVYGRAAYEAELERRVSCGFSSRCSSFYGDGHRSGRSEGGFAWTREGSIAEVGGAGGSCSSSVVGGVDGSGGGTRRRRNRQKTFERKRRKGLHAVQHGGRDGATAPGQDFTKWEISYDPFSGKGDDLEHDERIIEVEVEAVTTEEGGGRCCSGLGTNATTVVTGSPRKNQNRKSTGREGNEQEGEERRAGRETAGEEENPALPEIMPVYYSAGVAHATTEMEGEARMMTVHYGSRWDASQRSLDQSSTKRGAAGGLRSENIISGVAASFGGSHPPISPSSPFSSTNHEISVVSNSERAEEDRGMTSLPISSSASYPRGAREPRAASPLLSPAFARGNRDKEVGRHTPVRSTGETGVSTGTFTSSSLLPPPPPSAPPPHHRDNHYDPTRWTGGRVEENLAISGFFLSHPHLASPPPPPVSHEG